MAFPGGMQPRTSLTINGTAGVGNVLTVSSGYTSYQWLRQAGGAGPFVNIANANSASYTQVAADLGANIACFASSPAVMVPPVAPAAPLVAIIGGNTQNTINWIDQSNNGATITAHQIFRNGTLLTTVSTANYVDTGLTNGTTYSYNVVAVNSAGSSLQSTTHTGTPSGSFSSFTYDTDAQAIITRMTAQGATPNSRRAYWINSTVKMLKAKGVWAALKGAGSNYALYMPSDQSAASLVNWLTPGTNDLTVSTTAPTFTSPVATAGGSVVPTNGGWLATAAANYLDTGIQYGNQLNINNCAFGVVRGGAAESTAVECGVFDGSGGLEMAVYNTSGVMTARSFSGSLGTLGTTLNWDGLGLHCVNRTSSSSVSVYKNAQKVATSTTASVTPATPTLTFHFVTCNGNNTTGTGPFLGGFVGGSLTDVQQMWLSVAFKQMGEIVAWGDPLFYEAGVGAGSVSADVLIYGWTFGAINAAFEIMRQGHSVAVIGGWNDYTPGDLGGMPSNGLCITDCLNFAAIGGLPNSLFNRASNVYATPYFQNPSNSTREVMMQVSDGARGTGRFAGQTIPYYISGGVTSASYNSATGYTVQTTDGRIFNGTIALDCSYDGDLLLALGVPAFIGREAASGTTGSTLNGFTGTVQYGGFETGFNTTTVVPYSVDPYVTPGVPSSGFAPGIAGNMPSETVGQADSYVQAAGFRLTLRNTTTSVAEALSWSSFFSLVMGGAPQVGSQPAYTSSALGQNGPYELIGRFSAVVTAAGAAMAFTDNYSVKQIGSTLYSDWNSGNCMGLDLMGSGTLYANTGLNYTARLAVLQKAQNYTLQMLYSQTVDVSDTRIPSSYFSAMNSRTIPDNQYFWPGPNGILFALPNQLYIRDRLRLSSGIGGAKWTGDISYQVDGQAPTLGTHTVATASYFLDSHCMDRYADLSVSPARCFNEGGLGGQGACGSNQLGPVPFEICCPDKSIMPNIGTCWSVASDHAGFGCLRLEPVSGQLGQSLGMAACVALDNGVTLQDAGTTLYATATTGLRARLLATPEANPPVLNQVT